MWKVHHEFKDGNVESAAKVNLNQTYAYLIKKKVVKVFRFQAKDENSEGIGVLFQDGSFEKLRIENDADGNAHVWQLDGK